MINVETSQLLQTAELPTFSVLPTEWEQFPDTFRSPACSASEKYYIAYLLCHPNPETVLLIHPDGMTELALRKPHDFGERTITTSKGIIYKVKSHENNVVPVRRMYTGKTPSTVKLLTEYLPHNLAGIPSTFRDPLFRRISFLVSEKKNPFLDFHTLAMLAQIRILSDAETLRPFLAAWKVSQLPLKANMLSTVAPMFRSEFARNFFDQNLIDSYLRSRYAVRRDY